MRSHFQLKQWWDQCKMHRHEHLTKLCARATSNLTQARTEWVRQRQSLARIVMAFNNMAQQVVKGLPSLTLPCAGTWHLIQRWMECCDVESELQEFLPFWAGFPGNQCVLVSDSTAAASLLHAAHIYESEMNTLKQKKSITPSCKNCVSQRTSNFLKWHAAMYFSIQDIKACKLLNVEMGKYDSC